MTKQTIFRLCQLMKDKLRQKNYQLPLPTMHTLFGLLLDIFSKFVGLLVASKLNGALRTLINVGAGLLEKVATVNSRPILIRWEQPIMGRGER